MSGGLSLFLGYLVLLLIVELVIAYLTRDRK